MLGRGIGMQIAPCAVESSPNDGWQDKRWRLIPIGMSAVLFMKITLDRVRDRDKGGVDEGA